MKQMTYTLFRLAPGSYDVVLGAEIVASLVRGHGEGATWTAELLDESRMPAPFTAAEHEFRSFDEACRWLGDPKVTDPRESGWARG